MVFGICRLIDILVPDVPESLEVKIKRERYLAKQALADTDTIMKVRTAPPLPSLLLKEKTINLFSFCSLVPSLSQFVFEPVPQFELWLFVLMHLALCHCKVLRC